MCEIGASAESRGNFNDPRLEIALDLYGQAAYSNLIGLISRIDRAALERAIQALIDARRVYVVGTLESHSDAMYMYRVASRQLYNWRLVAHHHLSLRHLRIDCTPADVVVGIERNPYGDHVFPAVRHAHLIGARVIGITDWRKSPVAYYANELLHVSVQSPSNMVCNVATTAIVDMLVGMVARLSDG